MSFKSTLLTVAAFAAATLVLPAATACAAQTDSSLGNGAGGGFGSQDANGNGMGDHTRGREDVARLHVRGTAELEKPADQLRISIGVVTEDDDATQAMNDNSRRMRRVLEAVEDAGLEDDEYETGSFQVRPVYSQRPPRQQMEENWRPRIIAYSVTNTINVKTQQLELAGEIIQAANEAGANTIDSIQFTLADARTHRAEAIAVATANARQDARALAGAAGVQLVRVLEVRLDDAQPIRPPQPFGYERAMATQADSSAPVSPGDVTVRSSVNLVYEIKPAP